MKRKRFTFYILRAAFWLKVLFKCNSNVWKSYNFIQCQETDVCKSSGQVVYLLNLYSCAFMSISHGHRIEWHSKLDLFDCSSVLQPTRPTSFALSSIQQNKFRAFSVIYCYSIQKFYCFNMRFTFDLQISRWGVISAFESCVKKDLISKTVIFKLDFQ